MTTAQTMRLDRLDSRIRAMWARAQALHLLAGALALFRWAVPLFLVGMTIDWLTYTPAPGRVVMTIALLGVSLYQAWRCGWRHLRRFDARRAALQLEQHHGDLNSLLISALQFRDNAANGGGADALREQACRKAEEAAADLHPERAVPYGVLRRPAIIVALFAGVIAVFAAVNGPFLSAGLMRFFCPWIAAAYPTDTQITLEQETLVIKEGDSARIEARLDGVVPDTGTIDVRTGEGRAREIDLEVVDGRCVYTIASASRDFTYRVKAGDARSGLASGAGGPGAAACSARSKWNSSIPGYIEPLRRDRSRRSR